MRQFLLICRKFCLSERSILFTFWDGCRKLNTPFFSNRRLFGVFRFAFSKLIPLSSTVRRLLFCVRQTDSAFVGCSASFTLRSADTKQNKTIGYPSRVSDCLRILSVLYKFQRKMPNPPAQLIFSEAARVICRKPIASSSRARFSEPASMNASPLPSNAATSLSLAS